MTNTGMRLVQVDAPKSPGLQIVFRRTITGHRARIAVAVAGAVARLAQVAAHPVQLAELQLARRNITVGSFSLWRGRTPFWRCGLFAKQI